MKTANLESETQLFQSLAVVEGVADTGAEGYVAVVDGIEGYQLHFFDIGFTVSGCRRKSKPYRQLPKFRL